MGLLNPALIGLLGLGAVPIVIHLLNRRRFVVVKWPAMVFLLRAQEQTRKRLRMENWILLAARTLAVLLFAFAATRPFLPSATALQALGPDRQHLYVVIDNSASMGYQEGLSTLLQKAVREAKKAVDDSIRPDDPVTLVVACDELRRRNGRPLVLLHGTADHGKVKETLDRIPLSSARLDPAAALAAVASVAQPGDIRRTLLILSDFQQADWAPYATAGAAKAGEDASSAIRIQLDRLEQLRFDLRGAFRFLGSSDPEDYGVLAVGPADARVPVEGNPLAFEVVVGNNGPAPVACEIRFLVDDREVGSQRISIRGRASRSPSPETARAVFPWSGAAGPHYAAAEVVGPGNRLRANDRRGHGFVIREKVRVLLVDGDPAPERKPYPETRLLEISLSLQRGIAPAEVRTIPATDLGRETFAGVDVAILANIDRVPDETWDRLGSFVRSGGGLLVFLGDKVEPSLWNAALRRPSVADMIPARLAHAARVDGETPFAIDLTSSEHPALRDLTDPRAGTSFEAPLVSGWWPVQAPLEEGTEVLLRLRDLARTPYLLQRLHGRGRTLLCTSSADDDWTALNLFFAPFVQELTSYLASAGAERRDLLIHEALVAEVPEAARSIVVVAPDGQSNDVEGARRGDAPDGPRAVLFPTTSLPGRYTVRWKAPPDGRDLSGDLEATERHYAVDIDPKEADVARLAPGALEDRFRKRGLGAGEDPADAKKAREKDADRGDLTGLVLALGLAMVVAEMFLASLFGRKRR